MPLRRVLCYVFGTVAMPPFGQTVQSRRHPVSLPVQSPGRPVFVAGAIVGPILYMANVASGGCGIPFCLRKCRLRLLVGVRARVRRGIYALQLRDVVVGVDLCCLEGGVAHQLLYFAQVGAVVEQVCGESVPQHVGRAFALHAALGQQPRYAALDVAAGYTFSRSR